MAIHFEAKKHAWRQTQDGIVVSFVLHPSEIDAGFAVAPLGTRYIVAVEQIGDDETPVQPQTPSGKAIGGHARAEALSPERRAEIAKTAADTRWNKERTPFKDLPLSQQAAIRCGDKQFRQFLIDNHGLGAKNDDTDVVLLVRHLCDVKSRSELDYESRGHMWLDLEKQFQSWRTTQQYADYAR